MVRQFHGRSDFIRDVNIARLSDVETRRGRRELHCGRILNHEGSRRKRKKQYQPAKGYPMDKEPSQLRKAHLTQQCPFIQCHIRLYAIQPLHQLSNMNPPPNLNPHPCMSSSPSCTVKIINNYSWMLFSTGISSFLPNAHPIQLDLFPLVSSTLARRFSW